MAPAPGTAPGYAIMPSMTRKPWFWLLFAVLAAGAAVAAWHLFPLGNSLVTLDIRMDRRAALSRAEALAHAQGLGPEGPATQAATFNADGEAQRFIELEAGGREAFQHLMDQGLYAPYSWWVRRFRQGEVHESWIRFTPAGEPYDFIDILAEQDPGPALPEEEARRIAENTAQRPPWNVDLAPFMPISAARTEQPGGRVDHRFVYERRGVDLGAGRLRLDLVVSGERLTELRHYVKVPESFTRRYAALRSANEALATGGNVAMYLFYLVFGCGVGLFFLLRRRVVLWRPALLLALVITAVSLAAQLNQWPLLWIGYDTALSHQDFVEQRLASLLLGALVDGLLVFLGILGAESLSRQAFPQHPQLWRLGTREAASSRQLLGRTLAGYLLTPIVLAYVSAFYAVTLRRLGWWNPVTPLTHPDVLATYLPWLGPLGLSLHAGIWEECLFRAIPLAGAALLGERLGRRRQAIALGFIVQMLVFGAVHANYPTQPSYARLVELLLPSALFGALYLVYGLVPGIVLHFSFDLVLSGLPILASSTTTSRIDQGLLLVLGLAPLGVLLVAWRRHGRLGELPETLRNGAWQPEAPSGSSVETPDSHPGPAGLVLGPALRVLLAVLGVLGLVLWGLALGRDHLLPRLLIDRAAAIAAARQALAERGVRLGDRFQALAVMTQPSDLDHRLVWQTAGPVTYRSLLGEDLDPPLWRIRFASFTGDMAERAEEWRVDVLGDGHIYNVEHQLPEGRPGAMLDVAEARTRVHELLRRELHLDPTALRELEAVPSQRPDRVDWYFEFRDPTVPPLPEGERRIRVALAGAERSEVARFVYAPEAWERLDRQRGSRRKIFDWLSYVSLRVVLLVGGIAGIIAWSHRRLFVRRALVLLSIALVVRLGALGLEVPAAMARFSTAEPYDLQLVSHLVTQGLWITAWAAFAALGAGLGVRRAPRAPGPGGGATHVPLGWGFVAGAFFGGLYIFLPGALPTLMPPRPDLSEMDAWAPTVAQAFGLVQSMLTWTTWLYLVALAGRWLERRGTRRGALAAGLAVYALGFWGWNAGLAELLTASGWLVMGFAGGLLILGAYSLVKRDLGLTPTLICMLVILPELRWAFMRPAPRALGGTLLGSVAVVALALGWARSLRGRDAQ
jgi:hypothetical protein